MAKHTLQGKRVLASFCTQTGQLASFQLTGDTLEYMGNAENTSYPSILERNQWMGDWRFRVWRNGHFQEELSAQSRDIRKVDCDEHSVTVRYEGESQQEQGLSSLELVQRYFIQEDALCWEARITNRTDESLEVGEASLAFMTNTDFSGIFKDPSLTGLPNWHGEKQRQFHEERLFQHLCINGRSSYALLQRPKGDWPAVLFQPTGETLLEAAYQMDKHLASQFSVVFEGPYYLSIYSNGALRCEEWNAMTEATRVCPCGNRSLMLAPGESHLFSFRFAAIDSIAEMEKEMVEQGQVVVQARPGMVAPVDQPILFSIQSKDPFSLLPNGNMYIEVLGQEEDTHFYRLTANQSGQKQIIVKQEQGDSHLFFLMTENPEKLLKRRAAFAADFQFYDNPQDIWSRHHLFLPYDDKLSTLFLDSLETWQVSGTDELCLPTAMFLAEKNCLYPNEHEIGVLESFVEDGLFGKLQNRETYLTVRSLRWVPDEEIYPSDKVFWGKGNKTWATSTSRCFQYALVSDIYYSMYRLAKAGHTHLRDAATYLEMMYRTALNWFDNNIGDNKWNGGPSGATIISMLQSLKEENQEWFEELDRRVREAVTLNAEAVYPYGSELMVDQTAHDQLYAMLSYYGCNEKAAEVRTVTKALRNGHQPIWYQFGNDKRGNVCCWYGTPMNSRILYETYEITGDKDALRLGYGGLSSFLSTIRRDGAAYGWFLCWPDRFGFDSRSLDTDMGLYNYLRHARAYVDMDQAFGLVGYGCRPEASGDQLEITILDGVGCHVHIAPLGLEISAVHGGIEYLCLNRRTKSCIIRFDKESSSTIEDVSIQAEEPWTIETKE